MLIIHSRPAHSMSLKGNIFLMIEHHLEVSLTIQHLSGLFHTELLNLQPVGELSSNLLHCDWLSC